MSFSNEVKRELCKNVNTDVNLLRSELYAMLLLSKTFSSEKIVFKTENRNTVGRFVSLLSMLFNPIVEKIEPKGNKRNFIVRIIDSNESRKIFEFYGHDDKELSLRVNRAFVDSEDEIRAFASGAFLASGSVTEPNKDYHLEFVISKRNLALDICHIINEIPETNINIKMHERNGSFMAYLKDSEKITDFLAFIGAYNCAMEIMGTKALKQIRNQVNRKANSEIANIERQSKAYIVQSKAINKLMDNGKFNFLSDDLKEIAKIRLENPDMSLKELGELLNPPLSRSGVNHRLEKIIKIASE